MKRVSFVNARLIAALLAALIATPASSQVGESCPPLTHRVPAETIAALAKGFNLAGWTDDPDMIAKVSKTLRDLRKSGMTHIRLPVPAENVMSIYSSAVDRGAKLAALDRALKDLTTMGFVVSVDVHPGDAFNQMHKKAPEVAMGQLQDAWRALAPVIARYPAKMVYAELLNEPDVSAEIWQTQAEQLARFVRELLPDTTIIVGPVNWQRPDSLEGFRALEDLNVVYAIHFYDPMAFTHQGHWDANDPLSDIRGLPFPIVATEKAVVALDAQLSAAHNTAALQILREATIHGAGDIVSTNLEPAIRWQQQNRRPIIINEFGVLKAHAPRDSRLRWLRSVVEHAEQHCWGWAHWELAQGFGLMDDRIGRPDGGVLRALLRRP